VVEIDPALVPEDRIDTETGKLRVPAVYFSCQDPFEISQNVGGEDTCVACEPYEFPDSSKT
jgi:hypothetical protein